MRTVENVPQSDQRVQHLRQLRQLTYPTDYSVHTARAKLFPSYTLLLYYSGVRDVNGTNPFLNVIFTSRSSVSARIGKEIQASERPLSLCRLGLDSTRTLRTTKLSTLRFRLRMIVSYRAYGVGLRTTTVPVT